MALLRAHYVGRIHWRSGDGGAAKVELLDGEGPAQILDQIQAVAGQRIREATDPGGTFLRWQELDLEAGAVRRHRSALHGPLTFALCADDQGIELRLDGTPCRPWVPLRPLAEPGHAQRALLGWSVRRPRFEWRYLDVEHAPPTLEATWACDGLPRAWAELVRAQAPSIECTFGDGGQDVRCTLRPGSRRELLYRGHEPLSGLASLPASWPVSLVPPLALVEEGPAEDSLSPPEVRREVPMTVAALDFLAVLEGRRRSRLVASGELHRPFCAEVVTAAGVLLPAEIPAGMIPALPWTLAVREVENRSHGRVPREAGRKDTPGNGARRWLLTPVPNDTGRGVWREVEWPEEPAVLRFGLGSFDFARAPQITRVGHRRARVTWQLGPSEDLLCLTLPQWTASGHPEGVTLPYLENDFDYGTQVRVDLGGLEERFTIEPDSEIPERRLLLDPRRWRLYDETAGDVDGEILGEVGGHVWWRRPAALVEKDTRSRLASPADWAGGSGPVLLFRRSGEGSPAWGGFYAPEPVPWAALEEALPEGIDPAAPRPAEMRILPRSNVPAIWILLHGFLCRYDRLSLEMGSPSGSESVTAWVARWGLPLFPRRRGFLLRSFAPFYAVRDREPRRLALELSVPRPTLRVGHELLDGSVQVVEIGDETRLRHQVTAASEIPTTFGPGRIPGTRLHLGDGRLVWFALEQAAAAGSSPRQSGYLLSWDRASGFELRGFFAHDGVPVELGTVLGGSGRVWLGGKRREERLSLEIDRAGFRFSKTVPRALAEAVTPEMIRLWEKRFFTRRDPPPPLSGHDIRVLRQPSEAEEDPCWVFELIERGGTAVPEPPLAIRVWEPQEEASEELLTTIRKLGEDAGRPAETLPLPTPEKTPAEPRKLLRDDDDEGF